MKSISVIMSTRDTDNNILKCAIDSILNQSFTDFEFIIVCDGSRSNLEILNSLKDNRVKIIINDVAKGLPYSLNKAIDVSDAKYIARMDSDDYSLPNRLKIQYDFMEKHLNIDICSTYSKNFGDSKRNNINIFTENNLIKSQLLIENALIHPSVIIRKSFIDAHNIRYSESFKYSQDFELWNRISPIANFGIIPRVCLMYRIHNNQISTSKKDEQLKLCEYIYMRNLQNLRTKDESEYLNYFYFLSGKKNIKIDKNRIENFIATLIEIKKNYIDKKSLKEFLYFSYCKNYIRFYKKMPPLKIILSWMVIKNIFRFAIYKVIFFIKTIYLNLYITKIERKYCEKHS